MTDDFEPGTSKIDLDMAPETARENERNSTLMDATHRSEMSTIIEEPSVAAETPRERNKRSNATSRNREEESRDIAETSLRYVGRGHHLTGYSFSSNFTFYILFCLV